jgi:hypothetical protein
MTSPPKQIEIECPNCHHRFKTWYRASMNLSLDPFTDDDVEENETKTCPWCKAKILLDTLVVEKDGTWRLDAEEP